MKIEVSRDADPKYVVTHTQLIFRAVGVTQLYVQLDYEQSTSTYKNLQNPNFYWYCISTTSAQISHKSSDIFTISGQVTFFNDSKFIWRRNYKLIDPINMKYIFSSIRLFLEPEFYVKMHL